MPLTAANEALDRLRGGRLRGAAVLTMGRGGRPSRETGRPESTSGPRTGPDVGV